MKSERVYGDISSVGDNMCPDQPQFDLVWLDKQEVQSQKGYELIKRMMDFVFAVFGMIFLLPVMLWVAYKVHKEEPDAPVIFAQKRIGRNGKEFTMYKFRSMCTDAEKQLTDLLCKNEVNGAMFKIKEDPRVTKFGKFIRRTSLDELPQLINVIKGDMSLIGPRPPLQREVAEYTEYDQQRLLVKPGCSGHWQVSGRSDVHFEEMVRMDVEYIQQRCIGCDVSLILKTIRVMLKMDGAY